jgi:hypothetical protein
MKIKHLLVIFAFLLTSCSVVDGTQYQHQSCDLGGAGVVTFYQESGFVGSGLMPLLRIDGVDIGPVPKGGYISVQMMPGKHTLELVDNKNDLAAWRKSEDITAEFDVLSGQERLFKFYVRSWSPGIPIPVGAIFIPVGGSRASAVLDIPYDQASGVLDKLKGKVVSFNGSSVSLETAHCGNAGL